jgi:Zn-dependent peptidase ImmA (M78 family)/transcriptional regulator with XRE-family HTH domain
MAVKTPIPQNIRRIRTSRGLSQEQVARKAGVSRNAYGSIERGEAEPRVSNLEGIARALGVDLPALLAEAPRLSSVRFRSAKVRSRRAEGTRDQVVAEVARWVKDFNGLEDLLGERREYKLAGLGARLPDESDPNRPIEAARQTRKVLQLGPNEPIRDICGLLESAGVKVLGLGLDIEGLFGLSVGESDGGPAVVVNVHKDVSVERRIFTAAHELGHLLLHPGAYDVGEVREDRNEDREANLFASQFLMPGAAFQKEWRRSYGLAFVDRVLHVKRIFRVSYQTVLYRLSDLGITGSGDVWGVFSGQWRDRTGQALTKKAEPMPLAEVDFLEDRLSRLVRRGVEAEKITVSRGAEILGVNLRTMRDRVASWKVAG